MSTLALSPFASEPRLAHHPHRIFQHWADTPAGRCVWVLQHLPQAVRSDFLRHTRLSQPSVTRTVNNLMNAGLVRERPDLIVPNGPGRPSIPLELAPSPWVHVAVALGPDHSDVTLLDTHGHTIVSHTLRIHPTAAPPARFGEELGTIVASLVERVALPVASVGVVTAGIVEDQLVTNREWLWKCVDIRRPFAHALGTPDIPRAVNNLAVGLVMAERLNQLPSTNTSNEAHNCVVLTLDGTPTAAWSDKHGIHGATRLEVVDAQLSAAHSAQGRVSYAQHWKQLADRPLHLTRVASTLVDEAKANSVILVGETCSQDPHAIHAITSGIHRTRPEVSVRTISDVHHAITTAARAAALRPLFIDPLGLSKLIG